MKITPDKSQHLIICDPPYFEVKGEFDFIWSTFEDYLADVEKWAIEIKRILATNGTLLWWGHAKKIAYTQIILDKYFHLCNSLVWKKLDCQTRSASFSDARAFAPVTERILLYSDSEKDVILEDEIKPRHPFALYIKEEFKKAKVNNKEIAKLFPSRTGGLTGCVSNWLNGDNTPTKEQYLKIRDYLNGEYLTQEYEYLTQEYEDLRLEYEDLRLEYEEQRRQFNNTMKLEDVLEFSQESSQTAQHKHPTQKAPKLCRALIHTCSKKGQNLFIPFLGSGVEAVEGINYGLNVTGSELDKDYFEAMQKRIKQETAQVSLF